MLGRVMHATARMSPPVKSRTGVTCQRTVRGARILAFGARRPSPEPTLLRFSSDLRAELRASTMSTAAAGSAAPATASAAKATTGAAAGGAATKATMDTATKATAAGAPAAAGTAAKGTAGAAGTAAGAAPAAAKAGTAAATGGAAGAAGTAAKGTAGAAGPASGAATGAVTGAGKAAAGGAAGAAAGGKGAAITAAKVAAVDIKPIFPTLENALRRYTPLFLQKLPGALGANAGTIMFLVLCMVLTIILWKLGDMVEGSQAPARPAKEKKAEAKEEKKEEEKFYTVQQVAEHNTTDSLWLIIEDRKEADPKRKLKIYDLTKFIDEHPGGDAALMQHAGAEATEGFYGPQHPDGVFDQVKEYFVGYVKQ